MKRLILTGCIGFLVLSCSKKENTSVESVSSTTTEVAKSEPVNMTGKEMIEASDCTGCHSDSEKLIGPSYKEIANKYSEKDIELLASKIIEGGSGVWGSVPMQSHPSISKEEAKKMVKYILSIK